MKQAAEARYSAVASGLRSDPEPRRSIFEPDAEHLLAIERQQRQLLNARLHAQMDANEALRRDNLELAAQSAATSRQLRAALRSRDELRHHAAEARALEDAVRAAVGRRSLQAAQALCASLRARVYALEGQVKQLQNSALRDEAVGGGAARPCRVETPRSLPPRRLSPHASPAGSPDAAVLGIGSETTCSRPPRQSAPPAATPDGAPTPDAAVLASFAGSLSAHERQVLLNLDATERTAVLRELLSLAAGVPERVLSQG